MGRFVVRWKKIYGLSLRIKNKYLCNILKQTCKLNGYTYPEINKEIENEVAKELYISTKKKFVYFSAALKVISEDRLLEALGWFKEQIEFSLGIADKIEKSKAKGKTMEDILRNL